MAYDNNPSAVAPQRSQSGYEYGRLPLIDVGSLLRKTVAPRAVVKTKGAHPDRALVEYLIWRHVKDGATASDLSREVKYTGKSVREVLRRYGVYTDKLVRSAALSDRDLKRLRKLHSRGLTPPKIAKRLGTSTKRVHRALRKFGLKYGTNAPADWVVTSEMGENTIGDYRRYARSIRHYTNTLYLRYSHIVDPQGLRGFDHHLDHRLSIYDGFNLGERPLPWQMLCHPANFEMLDGEANCSKGRRSTLTPRTLLKRIRSFEKTHGEVHLPVLGEATIGEVRYAKTAVETVQQRISEASAFSLREVRLIASGKLKVGNPDRLRGEHFTRDHYAYVIYLYLRKRRSLKQINARIGGKTSDVMLRRIGLPSPFKYSIETRQEIVRLHAQGLTLTEIATQLGVPKRVALTYIFRDGER